MKRLLAAAALLALALAGSASGGHARSSGTVRSSRFIQGGHVRITVAISTPVEIGRPLRGTFRVRNISKTTQSLQLGYPTSVWLVIHSPDGTAYDTRTAYELSGSLGGPYIPPTMLKPGQTVTGELFAPRVRWSGPLRITPGWGDTALPALHVAVTTPGPAPSSSTVLGDVIASSGHLLDQCTPPAGSVTVRGTIAAPKHSAPPLHAACTIRLHHERGFVRAQVLVVSPPTLRVHFRRPYERLPWVDTGHNATAVGWQFVVTSHGAISVDSTSVDSTKKAHGGAPDWQWTTSGVQPQPGSARCGGWGGGGGGPDGPLIEFVSACR